jgi:hypothetical protein
VVQHVSVMYRIRASVADSSGSAKLHHLSDVGENKLFSGT